MKTPTAIHLRDNHEIARYEGTNRTQLQEILSGNTALGQADQ